MSANTFTFLSTVNSTGAVDQAPTPAAEASAAAATPAQSIDLTDNEALPKKILQLLISGSMTKDQLRAELAGVLGAPLDAAFVDQLVEYLAKSEMVTVDQSGRVDLTDFAKQALSVFRVG